MQVCRAPPHTLVILLTIFSNMNESCILLGYWALVVNLDISAKADQAVIRFCDLHI